MTYANYIASIEIQSLWKGRKHIRWQLRPDVNILSGRNGEGKSTILNKLTAHLRTAPTSGELLGATRHGVTMHFSPANADAIRYDILRSFDRAFLQTDSMAKLTNLNLRTELDWQLYQIGRRYLDYQLNIGNRMIALLTSGKPNAQQEAQQVVNAKTRFLNIVDELFAQTGKKIDRDSGELRFIQYDEPLSPYLLSSGEKQLLLILLTALTQDRQPYVLFMDEPEASLHFEWQQRLVSIVRELNPNAQIILTTHSPALIMDGWQDCVTEVSDITMETDE